MGDRMAILELRASAIAAATLLLSTHAAALGPQKPADDVPPWPESRVFTERSGSPLFWRKPKPIAGIGVRPGIKGLMRVAGTDDGKPLAFGFDANVIGRFGLGRGAHTFALWPEAGYVFSGGSGHFGSVGLGPALASVPVGISVGLVPRLLLGVRDGRAAQGLRTSALAEVTFDDGNAWGLEACHQVTSFGDATVHEVSFGISLTLLAKRLR
jgi:hypothetical protein